MKAFAMMTIAAPLVLAPLSVACSGGGSGTPDAAGLAVDDKTWNAIFKTYGCTVHHNPSNPGGPTGDLDMSTPEAAYKNLVNVKAMGPACGTSGLTRVIPGDPEHSLLYLKVSHGPHGAAATPPCGGQMPLGCKDVPPPVPDYGCLGSMGSADDKTLLAWINGLPKN